MNWCWSFYFQGLFLAMKNIGLLVLCDFDVCLQKASKQYYDVSQLYSQVLQSQGSHSHGKSWKNVWSWKVMENKKKIQKSWKNKNFPLICIHNVVMDMVGSKIFQL